MGVLGTLGWYLKVKKISYPLMRVIYDTLVNMTFEQTKTPEEFNQRLWEYGKQAGTKMMFAYSERLGKHAKDFEEMAKTMNIAYKVFGGHGLSRVEVSDAKDVVYWGDTRCPVCEGVEIDLPGIRYCDFLAGIMQTGCDIRGFPAVVREEKCKATGADECVWVMRKKPTNKLSTSE